MKTKIILLMVLFIALIIGCTDLGKQPKALAFQLNMQPDSTAKFNNNPDSAILILSIPDWALGKILKDSSSLACQHPDSLKVLRLFDDALHQALVPNKTIGKYQLTRKINPCCPCGSGGSTCCQCDTQTVLASPSTMEASVKYNSAPLARTTTEGLDLFVLPSGATTLVIDGIGISSPLTLNMNN